MPATIPDSWRERLDGAREILAGAAHRTPIVTSRTLGERTSARVYLKCENFQRAGAFKFRGAFHALSRLGPEERERGVLTYSSGNHAQAIALAGRRLGIRTTIVMPTDAPRVKRAATAGYGAEVIDYDRAEATREELAARIEKERGLVVVPPYDHEDIVAGQATATIELLDQIREAEGAAPDLVLAPCGGGGLLSGTALATKSRAPSARVVGVEPELADDATRTFRTGTLHTIADPPTIADGKRTPSLGRVTMPLVLEHVDDMRTVTEREIVDAMRFLFERTKLVVEPSGVLGVAALLAGRIDLPPAPADGPPRVAVILSGGNVDPLVFAKLVTEGVPGANP